MIKSILPIFALLLFSTCVEREFNNPFDPKVPKRLTLIVSPREAGKITASPQLTTYATDDKVILTPAANENWVFKTWMGDAAGSSVPLSLVMDSNKSVTAFFERKNYQLKITVEGQGTVNETIVSTPTGREYPFGTVVRLTPIPNQGWIFERWGGDLSGTDSPKNITIDKEKNVTVRFFRPAITTLDCQSSTNNGVLIETLLSSNVSSVIPYTGGNGTAHSGQVVPSTGVTGLTATLAAGNFANGNGTLNYVISGTPNQAGIANFALNIGNRTCVLSRAVNPVGRITSLVCTSANNVGTLIAGQSANGVSSIIPYSGGNGSVHTGQVVNSTGVTGLTATLSPGTFVNGSGTLTYQITGTPSQTGTANFTLNIGGQTCVISRPVIAVGSISSLNCTSVTNNGSLTVGQHANGVNSIVPYSGGNGISHNGQTVQSTGVTGLTATLAPGTFANGSGTLTYTITGTPNQAGTANFTLNIGGQTCVISRPVIAVGSISSLNCTSVTNNGSLTVGQPANGVNSIVPYSGGNGISHSGQAVQSTGVTGLTATLAPGTFANGSGTLTYTITGTPTQAGTASFNLNIGGRTCVITRPVISVGLITSLNCTSVSSNGSLTVGQPANGVSSIIPYSGGNGISHSGQTVQSTGVTGLTATLAPGTFANGSGTLTYIITGTPAQAGTASFVLNIGGQTCVISRPVISVGLITSLNCTSVTNNGSLTVGQPANGVSSIVPYSGGNGFTHSGQTVQSTGVTGLTATLVPGTFANGSGTLTYIITGTPAQAGTASFALNIGGRTCVITRSVVPVGSISTLNCTSVTNNGILRAGQIATGVSSIVPYSGGNGSPHNGQTVQSTGVTGLTARLSAGSFANGSGTLTYTITGTPIRSGTASFVLNIGGRTCLITRIVN